MTPLRDASPRTMARVTGALFLLTIVCGIIAEGVIGGRVGRDAASIAANEALYRLGYTVYLVEMAAQIAMTIAYYVLLKPVSRPLALLMTAFSLTGCIIKTFSRVFYFAPLFVLGTEQRDLVSVLLRLNDQGAAMALVFFGFAGLVEGWLVIKSTFLPKFLGVLSLVGGIGWLTFIAPALGLRLFPVVAGIGILGSIATILWLLIKGVDEARWREMAAASAASIWR